MEINLGNERIVVLQATYTADQIREKALSRRVDVFGRVVKLIRRIKPEDIEITVFQKRFSLMYSWKLSKINELIDKLDERLARSKINEAQYEATSAQPGVFI